MRQALNQFVNLKYEMSDGQNPSYQKILNKAKKIIDSNAELDAKEMMKL